MIVTRSLPEQAALFRSLAASISNAGSAPLGTTWAQALSGASMQATWVLRGSTAACSSSASASHPTLPHLLCQPKVVAIAGSARSMNLADGASYAMLPLFQSPAAATAGSARFMSSSAKGAPPSSRLSSIKSAEQVHWAAQHGVAPPGLAAAEAGTEGQSIAGSLSKGFWTAKQDAFNLIPTVPKILGLGGLIPFVALSPMVASVLDFPDYVRDMAVGQVTYGALIVSFLGAVHWGIAMTSTLAGSRALLAQRERYVWSVFPSLAAWPAMMMEPAPGSLCIAMLLGICYMSDKAYSKTGSLPAWYMTLRGYLTIISILSMLSTTAFFLARDFERAMKRMAEEDKNKAQLLAERDAAAAAAALAAPHEYEVAAPKKKGWR